MSEIATDLFPPDGSSAPRNTLFRFCSDQPPGTIMQITVGGGMVYVYGFGWQSGWTGYTSQVGSNYYTTFWATSDLTDGAKTVVVTIGTTPTSWSVTVGPGKSMNSVAMEFSSSTFDGNFNGYMPFEPTATPTGGSAFNTGFN